MKHRILIIFFTIVAATNANAQFTHVGEFGFTAGAAQYFGDLNHNANFNTPKIALGAYYLKQFTPYLGMRVSAHFIQVGYMAFCQYELSGDCRKHRGEHQHRAWPHALCAHQSPQEDDTKQLYL